MYDNVDMSMYKNECPRTGFLELVPQFLTSVSNTGESHYGEYCNGFLDSLKVSVSDSRVKISGSSLCKYYLGDNFKTMTRGDTQRAIESISDRLHLPFDRANVTRIDFAQNLIMKYPESVYYPYLGESQYYRRLEQDNGIYYNNNKRQLLFYGKEHEQKAKREPIPELYKDQNVLRYELRYRQRIGKEFGQPVTAGLLYNEAFYRGLVKRWRDEYQAIQKIKTDLSIMKPTGSKIQFAQDLAFCTISKLGQPKVLATIKEWRETGYISKKQAHDLRRFVTDMSKISNDESNELIEELNRKVNEVARA
jgi:hypothetical protein